MAHRYAQELSKISGMAAANVGICHSIIRWLKSGPKNEDLCWHHWLEDIRNRKNACLKTETDIMASLLTHVSNDMRQRKAIPLPPSLLTLLTECMQHSAALSDQMFEQCETDPISDDLTSGPKIKIDITLAENTIEKWNELSRVCVSVIRDLIQ